MKNSSGKKRSTAFEATRAHHSLEAAEDYTELIADLEERYGEARTGIIAQELGVSHVTALRTIRRLQDEGYVQTADRKPVKLTAKGRRIAEFSKQRHQLLIEFFMSIGVPKHIAEIDVEGVEHHISATTLDYIKQHLAKV